MNFSSQNDQNNPVAKRKAAQRSRAQAVVSGNAAPSAPKAASNLPTPGPSLDAPGADNNAAPDADQPLPSTDQSVQYADDPSMFSCGNCTYFVADNQPCQKVSDPVVSGGRCKQFDAGGGSSNDQPTQNPAESNPFGAGQR